MTSAPLWLLFALPVVAILGALFALPPEDEEDTDQ